MYNTDYKIVRTLVMDVICHVENLIYHIISTYKFDVNLMSNVKFNISNNVIFSSKIDENRPKIGQISFVFSTSF